MKKKTPEPRVDTHEHVQFTISAVYYGADAEFIRKALGDKPAKRLLKICKWWADKRKNEK